MIINVIFQSTQTENRPYSEDITVIFFKSPCTFSIKREITNVFTPEYFLGSCCVPGDIDYIEAENKLLPI